MIPTNKTVEIYYLVDEFGALKTDCPKGDCIRG